MNNIQQFLEGECERLEARRYKLSCLDYGMYGNTVEELDSQIYRLRAQIKELQ